MVLDFLSYESDSVADLENSIKAGVLNLFSAMDLFECVVKYTDPLLRKMYLNAYNVRSEIDYC